ncbi:MAG TPA: DUF6265 family protein [Terriglobia bacterium]|nr:DUF6265 family protein [Terriglobia bacterium]
MKSSRIFLFLALAASIPSALPALSAAQASSPGVGKVKASDFSWMTGRWIGHLSNGTAEQICSTPQGGEMLCSFRVFVGGKPVMYELYSLYDTPTGPELRSLHFTPDLADKSLQQPMLMTLRAYSDKQVVFAGVPRTQIETSSLFRDSPTAMRGVILFKEQRIPHIEVRWEKVAYDARVDYNPVAQSKR